MSDSNLTVGELKRYIKDLPDDTPVYYQRIEENRGENMKTGQDCGDDAAYCGRCKYGFKNIEYYKWSSRSCKVFHTTECNNTYLWKDYTRCDQLNLDNNCQFYKMSIWYKIGRFFGNEYMV